MPAKGDRPAGPCLGGKTGATSPPGGWPENLVAAARAADVTDPRVLEAIRHTPGRRSCRLATPPGPIMTRPSPISRHQVTTRPSSSAAIIAAPALTGTEEGLRARCRAWLPGRAAGRPGGQHRHQAGPGRAGAPQLGRPRRRGMSPCTRRSRTAAAGADRDGGELAGNRAAVDQGPLSARSCGGAPASHGLQAGHRTLPEQPRSPRVGGRGRRDLPAAAW